MSLSALPIDDLPPSQLSSFDRLLQVWLEQRLTSVFLSACDRITQTLLSHCKWTLSHDADILLLTIYCTDVSTYWAIVSNIEQLGKSLAHITSNARLEIIPVDQKNLRIEIELDELSLNDNSN
jgi:hypothetical protein